MEKNNQKDRIAEGVDKPENPYRKWSTIWSVMELDWEDRTVTQIAEALYTTPSNVSNCIARIKRETGYIVPRKRGRVRRPFDE